MSTQSKLLKNGDNLAEGVRPIRNATNNKDDSSRPVTTTKPDDLDHGE